MVFNSYSLKAIRSASHHLGIGILIVIMVCVCSLQLKAQEPEHQTYKVSVKSKIRPPLKPQAVATHFYGGNGLPTTRNVFDVRVDHKGYTWFSSAAGVSRYDGYEFKNYTHLDGLADRMTIRSYADYKGRIWFTSLSGNLSYYENERIHEYKYNSILRPYIDRDLLASIHVDTNDVLHIGTYSSGYLTVSSTGVLSRPITDSTHQGIGVILLSDTIPLSFTNESSDKRGIITVFDENAQKLMSMNIEDTRTGKVYGKTIRCITMANGTFLLSYENQVVSFNSKKKLNIYPLNEEIISLKEDAFNGVWVGTSGEGIYYFPKGLSKKTPPINFYYGCTITGIDSDLESGIWVSSMNKGVFYFSTPYMTSILVKDVFEPATYANDHIVWPAKRADQLYLLSRRGFLMYNEDSTVHTIDLPKTLGGKSTSFSSLYLPDGENSIWFSGNNHFAKIKNGLVSFPENKTEVELSGLTFGVCPSRDGSFWFSKKSNLFHVVNGEIVRCLKFNYDVRSVAETMNGTLLVGTTNGLSQLKGDSVEYLGTSDSLLVAPILCIKEFQGSIWLGSQKYGLVRMQNNHTSMVRWKGQNLLSPRSFLIRENALWFISEGHLNKLSLSKDQPDQIRIDETSLPQVLWGNNEVLLMNWLGKLTIAGNSVIYQFEFIPDSKNTHNIPLHISQIKVNNKDTVIQENYKLNYGQNHIAIKYLAITNLTGRDTRYKYRIKGIDPNWIETSDKLVQYTSLPSGTHTFELFAKPVNGSWTKPQIISFTISPPYWETWWFITLCSMITVSLLWGAVNYRFRRLRKENALQIALNESQQHALSARMNPHFIFNALNSIKTFVLENDSVQSNDYIARFSKLMRQILDQSQYTLIPLEDELKALDNYVSLELMRGKDRFSYSIDVDKAIDQKKSKVPSLLLQPFVENAIWHGIMPLDRKGHISVSIKQKNEWIICTIEDDGVGREAPRQNTKAHKSASTQISSKRLELINKRFGTQIDVQLNDLKDENGLALGTKVDIPIPIEFKQ